MSTDEKLVIDEPNSVEVTNGQAKFTKDDEVIDVKPEQRLIGLTKEQLESYRNDPFWKPVRYVVFIAFWLIWVAMLIGAILIVVTSPKCVAKKEQAWFQNTVAYQIFTPTFKDSDNDGVGDFQGAKEKLNDLRKVGVNSIWTTPLFKTLKDEFNPAAVTDLKEIDNRFGSDEDLKELINEAHSLGLKFIADLPLTTSKDGVLATKAIGTNKLRLLDLTKPEVIKELKEAARKLLDFGVDGIHLAQYGLAYPNSAQQIQQLSLEIRTEALEHFHEDEPEDLLIFSDTPIAEPTAQINLYSRSLFNYPNITRNICQSHQFIDCFVQSAQFGVDEIKRNASTLPLWQLGDVHHQRPDFKTTAVQIPQAQAAATAIQLFLPGSVAIYYGEELGLPSVEDQQPQHGLMAWNEEKNSGFTEVDGQFFKQLPVRQVKELNFKKQYDETHSPLKGFKKLAQLRIRDEVFIEGDFTYNKTEGVHVFTRTLEGNEKAYILLVNWPTVPSDQTPKVYAVTRQMVPERKVTNTELVWNQPHNPKNPSQMITGSTKIELNPYEYALLRVNVS